jgi:hypothetical protein
MMAEAGIRSESPDSAIKEDAYAVLLSKLDALEQAIDEMCSVAIAAEIRRRQAVLLRR